MTEQEQKNQETLERVRASLGARYRREKRFRLFGLSSAITGLLFVAFLFISIVGNGYTAFWQNHVELAINFDPALIDPEATGDPKIIGSANFEKLARNGLATVFPDVSGRRDRRSLNRLLSSGAGYRLREMTLENPSLIGTTQPVWLPVDDEVDMLIKGYIDRELPEGSRRIKDQQIAWWTN